MFWAIAAFSFFSTIIGNAAYYILLESDENMKIKEMMNNIFDMQMEFFLSDDLVRDIRKSILENKFKLVRTDVEEVKFILDEQV